MEQAEKSQIQADKLQAKKDAVIQELERERKQNRPVIKPEDVAKVVARITNVPVSTILATERERLSDLEQKLSEHILGQEKAINQASDVIRRARLGLHDPRRPKASMLLVGPSGTGKTELCRALAVNLFGRPDALIKLDMSEFAEPHSISKLVGSPAGYVGYRESTKLTDAIRKKPHCVVCFDEIEKAHQDVQHTLLQVLEDGQITDSTGRTISLRNAYIVLTSNVGSDQLGKKALGFGGQANELSSVIEEEVKRIFKPELINRLDRIIVFNSLSNEHMRQILDRELNEVCNRLQQVQKVACEITDSVCDWLMSQNLPAEEGARAIRRLVEREISAPLGKYLIQKRKRSKIKITSSPEGLHFK